MVQDLGFHWIGNAGNSTNQSAHDQHLSKIKEELSESFPKFTEMLNSSSSSIEDQYHFSPTSHKKNIKTISSKGIYSNNAQNCTSFGGVAMPSRGNYSQIYPSINISNLNQSPSAISSSLDMNLQALNLLTSSEKYSGSFSQASHDSTLGVFKASPSFGLDHMQQLTHMYRPSCSPTNVSILLSSPVYVLLVVFVVVVRFWGIMIQHKKIDSIASWFIITWITLKTVSLLKILLSRSFIQCWAKWNLWDGYHLSIIIKFLLKYQIGWYYWNKLTLRGG